MSLTALIIGGVLLIVRIGALTVARRRLPSGCER
jgi:hypothetical protein